jgi:uncharacterized protein
MNLLDGLTPETLSERKLNWENPPVDWQPLDGGGIRVLAPGKADFFRDPSGSHVNDAAPFLFAEVTGDFIARAHVRPIFKSTYDSGVILVRHDPQTWAKLCFESTDFGTTAAVSVVTDGLSDDANGADITQPDLWLQMARAGDVFALHYSLDGQTWRMVRYFKLAMPERVKAGIVAQCPSGEDGSTIDFLYFSIEERTAKNLRAGA